MKQKFFESSDKKFLKKDYNFFLIFKKIVIILNHESSLDTKYA